MYRYFIIYKPFQVISGFRPENGKACLKDFFDVPSDVYPLGRLDYDSEGLLLLSNDKSLNHPLLHPGFAHEREYWVQVEGLAGADALDAWRSGIVISVDGKKYVTRKAKAHLFPAPPPVAERQPPIRFRKHIPTSWISLTLQEGKNRQVRKMTAAAGFPTLRLVRYRIGGITLEGMSPGDMREMDKKDCYNSLGLGTLI